MGRECCICGCSLSGINEYPLSSTINRRICIKCYDGVKLLHSEMIPTKKKGIKLVKQYMSENPMMEDFVREYVDCVIEKAEGETDVIKSYMENKEQERRNRKEDQIKSILITSSGFFQGYVIDKYIDYISSEVVMGMGVFKSLFASVSNITGTESSSLNKKLDEARETVMTKIKQKAYDLGANAIISLDIDYTMFGDTMVGVIANGTAVIVHCQKHDV